MYQNYCNWTILVQVIVEDIVACFFLACFFPRYSAYASVLCIVFCAALTAKLEKAEGYWQPSTPAI